MLILKSFCHDGQLNHFSNKRTYASNMFIQLTIILWLIFQAETRPYAATYRCIQWLSITRTLSTLWSRFFSSRFLFYIGIFTTYHINGMAWHYTGMLWWNEKPEICQKRSQQGEDIGRRWLDCTIQPQWAHSVLDVCTHVLILLLIDTHMHLWRFEQLWCCQARERTL